MFPVKVRLSETHLRELTSRPDTYVYCKELNRHINIEPSGLSHVKAAIRKTLDAAINKYDQTLGGIFLGYTNMKVLHNTGLVFYDDSFIHIDIKADFYVFTPELGCTLTGVVTKLSKSHIGCLVYSVFNASVVNTTDEEDWPGTSIQVGQEVQFEVTILKMNGPLPYIRGKLSEVFVTTSRQNHNKQSKEVEKSKKKKMSLQVNVVQQKEAKKNKKNKNVDALGTHSDVNVNDIGEVPVFDDFAKEITHMSMLTSDVRKQKKRKKPDDDANPLKDSNEQKKKRKLDDKRSPKEHELFDKTQNDSLCAESKNFLTTLNFDVLNSSNEVIKHVTYSKHKKAVSSTVHENLVTDHYSSKKNSSMIKIAEKVENTDNDTDFTSPKKKRKTHTHDKLSPILSCSKEGNASSVECSFEVESEAAVSSPTKKKKKKKEKQELESIVASPSEKEVNVNNVKNFKHGNKVILSSAEKKKKKEKIELDAFPTSENENNADVAKSFEEENTASLTSPTKTKKKKKDKHRSEATNTELENTFLIKNSVLLADKCKMKKERPVSVTDTVIGLPIHTNIENNFEQCDVGTVVSPIKKKKSKKKKVDPNFSHLVLDFESGTSTHAEKVHETNSTALSSPIKSSANKLHKQEFTLPKESILAVSGKPPDILLKEKGKYLTSKNATDEKNRHNKVKEVEGMELNNTNELVSALSTKDKSRRNENADTSSADISFQSGVDAVPTVSPTRRKHKKKQFVEMLPDVLLPSEVIQNTNSENNLQEGSKTASVVSPTKGKKGKAEKEGGVNVLKDPLSLANIKIADVHTKNSHGVSPPPSTKSDGTVDNLHSSTLESLLAHARSLFKESVDLNKIVTDEKSASDSLKLKHKNKKEIGSKKKAAGENKKTKEKIVSNIHSDVLRKESETDEDTMNNVRSGSIIHFTSAAQKKVSNHGTDDEDANSSSFESDNFMFPTKNKNKTRGAKKSVSDLQRTSKQRVASNLENVELADETKSVTAAKTDERKEDVVIQKVGELVESEVAGGGVENTVIGSEEAGARKKKHSNKHVRTTSEPKTHIAEIEKMRDIVSNSTSQEVKGVDMQDVRIALPLPSRDSKKHKSSMKTKNKEGKTKSKTSKHSIEKVLERLHVAQESELAESNEVGGRDEVHQSMTSSSSTIIHDDKHAQLSDEDKPRKMSPKKQRASSRSSTSLSPGKKEVYSPHKNKLNNRGSDKGTSVTNPVPTSLQLSPELLQQLNNAEEEQSEEEMLAAIFKTPEYFRSDSMANAEDRRNKKSNRRSLLSLNKPAIPVPALAPTYKDNSSPERLSPRGETRITKGHGIEGLGFISSDDESTSEHVTSSKVDVLKSTGGLQDITSRLLGLIPTIAETLPNIKQSDKEEKSGVKENQQLVKLSGGQSQLASSTGEKLEKHSITKKENTKEEKAKDRKHNKKKLKSSKQVSEANSDLSDVDKMREQLLKTCLTRFKTD